MERVVSVFPPDRKVMRRAPKRPGGEIYKYSQEFAVNNRKEIGIDLNMSKNPKDKAV